MRRIWSFFQDISFAGACRLVLVAVVVLLGVSVDAQWWRWGAPQRPRANANWVAPIGIPTPEFGLHETHLMYVGAQYAYSTGVGAYKDAGNGPYTHYVDAGSGSCTNTNNNYGTAAQPRCAIPSVSFVAPGAVIELHGSLSGTSQQSQIYIGTATQPIFVRGASAADRGVIDNKEILIRGQYVVYEHLEFVTKGPWVRSLSESAHHIALRDLLVTNGASVSMSGTSSFTTSFVLVLNNMITATDFDPEGGEFAENDNCGVDVADYTEDIWVLDNDISGFGGDAVGAGHDNNYTSKRWYVGRNILHGTGENGVDLKEVDGFVVSQNQLYNFTGLSAGASGTAIVVHYGPDVSAKNVWVLFNHIYDAVDTGIQVGGSQVFETWFIGNIIHDVHNAGLTAKAFETFTSCKINLVGNVFYNNDNGIKASGTAACGNLVFKNNIVSTIQNPSGYYIDNLSDSGYEAALSCSHNLFYPTGPTRDGTCTNGQSTDPLFVDAGADDFRLQAGSPAIDNGDATIMTDLSDAFLAYWGVDIRKDFAKVARPVGSGWDIGAHER